MTLTRHLDDLAAQSRWTYRAGGSSFTEPAALAAIALSAHRRRAAAMGPARWLAEMQQPNGAVGVAAGEPSPAWPTALALLAWSLVDRGARTRQFDGPVRRAAAWSLAARGKPGERSEHIGHNPTIPGWSWAADTASWLEPTCFFVLGLTAAGYRRHRRVLDGAQLIADRLLPSGGANYGNTIVLGQELLPHLAPSGLALATLALVATEQPLHNLGPRLRKLTAYLADSLDDAPPQSLSWALIGLTLAGLRPADAEERIAEALVDPRWQPPGTLELALLLLACEPGFLRSASDPQPALTSTAQ